MSDQEDNVFEQSINSKYSDWTTIFDPNEVEPYRLHWDESMTVRSRQNSGERSSDSECDMDEVRAQTQLLDLFNRLYETLLEDIRRADDSWDEGQEVNDLVERQLVLHGHGNQLAEMVVELSDYVQSKVSSINIHMERLKLKQEPAFKLTFRDDSAASHLRKWLQNSEATLEKVKDETCFLSNSQPDLQRLRATLQTLQLEIDTEGRHLLRAAKRHLTNRVLEPTADSLNVQKVQRNLESLEQRWLKLYLGGIEQIERINNLVQRFESDDENGSDLESVGSLEPARKRARPSTFSEPESLADDEDTIPFSSGEYRRISICHMTSTENIASDLDNSTDKGSNKGEREDGWSSSKTQDVGYSSGENSLHEALSRIESTPSQAQSTWMSSQNLVSSYYKTVPLDDAGATDNETPRLPIPGISLSLPDDEMNASMIVNVDIIEKSTIDTYDDYKEVMNMLDEKYNNIDPRLGTNWKELKSNNAKRISSLPRPPLRQPSALGRMSCDASSEDSDAQIAPNSTDSFSGFAFNALKVYSPPTSSIRKRRYQRNSTLKQSESLHNSFISCGKMDQSVYEFNATEVMSQSLNLSTRALNNRRRFLRRQMHRSASENTNNILGVEKTSVKRRDSLNSNSSGTTFQDSGDAHFEWDDYRDESVVSHDLDESTNFSLDFSSPLLAPLMVDEDFQTELPLMDTAEQSGVANFIVQSRNALQKARVAVEGDKEAGKSVAQIAAEQLKSIRSLMTAAVSFDPNGAEALNKLHAEWLDLINSFNLLSEDSLTRYEIEEVMDLFRTINHHYLLFGSMCDGSDAKLLKESTLDDLRETLKTRKKLFQQLRTNYMRMMTLVSRVPNLVPELEMVINNINVLNSSVSNLENFYELYCVKEKVVELDGGVKELDNCLEELSKRSVLTLNGSLECRVREIDEELSHCQDRMASLEHVCNAIISRLNSSKFEKDDEELECCQKFVKDFDGMKRTISQIKTRLDRLFKLFPDCSSRSQQHDDSYSDSSLPDSIAKPRKRRNLSEETKEICPETKESPRMSWLTPGRLVSPLKMAASSSRCLVVCMVMLAIGTLLLGMVMDEEVFSRNGHWSFRFGPQLHYVDGPPPV